MIPRTLSASSLQVAALCMDRWASEYIDRAPAIDNNAAKVGTSVHGGFEEYVKAFFINKTHSLELTAKQRLEYLETLYLMSYVETFGSADTSSEEYEDGLEMTRRWFKRTKLEEKAMIRVETVEVKETIKVPYNHPNGGVEYINFNYLMDRVDQIEPTIWEVVDYKTVRLPIYPEDLEHKIQARAYGLAIQIKHPEATEVRVTFDLLRHEPVTIVLTRDDNIATWNYLTAEVQRIVDLPREKVRPTLNAECGYCVKKFSCKKLSANIEAGGIHSITPNEAVTKIDELKKQMKASKLIIEGLEEIVLRHAAEADTLEWITDDQLQVEVGVSRRRTFPAQVAAEIMGAEVFAQMGSMTLGNLEKIIGDESIDAEKRKKLKDLITWTNGDLQLKIKERKKLI